ncbi:uncharacterized protein [Watersipora subatra]|uniref:uncharacterized protein n=1 Tax=Watersipora subatra TaxID=2589382 RepID=UPI00355C7912
MDADQQTANLLLLMGSDSVPIYNQFTFHATEEGRTKILDNVIAMFDRHFEPVKNVIFERVRFNSIKQGTQSIHQFITQIHSQADNCDYGTIRDEMVRDRIVVGVADDKLREYLIDVEDLDLNKCITKAKQYVSHHAQVLKMTSQEMGTENLDTVKQSQSVDIVRQYRTGYQARSGDDYRQDRFSSQKRQGPINSKERPKCDFCNKPAHPKDRCPARNSICHMCKGRGHWARAKVCKVGYGNRAEEVECDELEGLFLGNSE